MKIKCKNCGKVLKYENAIGRKKAKIKICSWCGLDKETIEYLKEKEE